MQAQARLRLGVFFCLVSLLVTACGGDGGTNATPPEAREAKWGLLAADATAGALALPVSLAVKPGSASTSSTDALGVEDQTGDDDDYNSYVDFTPARGGLTAVFALAIPAGVDATKANVTLVANYRGWDKAQQAWKFSVYDLTSSSWVQVGDNAAAAAWQWTELRFALPGKLSRYASAGRIQVRFATTSRKENANLDYLAAELSGGAAPSPAPQPTAVPTQAPTQAPSPGTGLPGTGRIPAGPLHGLTLDSIEGLPAIVTSLGRLSKRATARIVFDQGMDPSYYSDAVDQIGNVAYVMGELLDSFAVKDISVTAYKQRMQQYLAAFGTKVDIWEVGNEINGEWLGNTSDVVAKMTGAYDLAKAAGVTTELTLYMNQDCWSSADHEMFTWTQANVPARMKQGLDYVLVSFYEDDCNGVQPDWPSVFARLHDMFPSSRIGFGEVGTKYADRKNEYITRYYSMSIADPHYVGGYFWWYGKQDLVPYTTSYWKTFDGVIATH